MVKESNKKLKEIYVRIKILRGNICKIAASNESETLPKINSGS